MTVFRDLPCAHAYTSFEPEGPEDGTPAHHLGAS